jgi:mRNA interferase MazF
LSFGEVVVRDWQGAGLLKASVIKPVFATLARRLIIKSLGQLQSPDHQALKQAIAQVLG